MPLMPLNEMVKMTNLGKAKNLVKMKQMKLVRATLLVKSMELKAMQMVTTHPVNAKPPQVVNLNYLQLQIHQQPLNLDLEYPDCSNLRPQVHQLLDLLAFL